MTRLIDPELLYVECNQCGHPILWKHGMTSKLLGMAGIDPLSLDERCVIMADGCPGCTPGETSFTIQVVRLNPEKEGRRKQPAMATN